MPSVVSVPGEAAATSQAKTESTLTEQPQEDANGGTTDKAPGMDVSMSLADRFERVEVKEAADSAAAGPGGLVTSGTDECSSGGGPPPTAAVFASSGQDEHASGHENMLKEGRGPDNETENSAGIGPAAGFGFIFVPDERDGGEKSEGFGTRAGGSVHGALVGGVPLSVGGPPAVEAAESSGETASSNCKSRVAATEGVAETTVIASAAGVCLAENSPSVSASAPAPVSVSAAAVATEAAIEPGKGEATAAAARVSGDVNAVHDKDRDVAGDALADVSDDISDAIAGDGSDAVMTESSQGSGDDVGRQVVDNEISDDKNAKEDVAIVLPEAQAVLTAHRDDLDEDITGCGVACSDQQVPTVDRDVRIADKVAIPSPGSPSCRSTPGTSQQQFLGVVGHNIPSLTSTLQPNEGLTEPSSSPALDLVSGVEIGSSSPRVPSSPSSCASLTLEVTADEPIGEARPSVSSKDTHQAAQTTTVANNRSSSTADNDVPVLPVSTETVTSSTTSKTVGGMSVAKSLARSFMAGERRHSSSARRSSSGGASAMFFKSRSPANSKTRRDSESAPVLSRTAELLSGERKGGLAALEEQVRAEVAC